MLTKFQRNFLSLILRHLALASLIMLLHGAANAHVFKGMTTRIIIELNKVTVTMRVAPQDVAWLCPPVDTDRDVMLTDEELAAGKAGILSEISRRFGLANNGNPLVPAKTSVEATRDELTGDSPHDLIVELVYEAKKGNLGRLVIDPNLFNGTVADVPAGSKPPQEGYNNTVSIIDVGKFLVIQASGTQKYETVVDAKAVRAPESSEIKAVGSDPLTSAPTSKTAADSAAAAVERGLL